jgi:integrase
VSIPVSRWNSHRSRQRAPSLKGTPVDLGNARRRYLHPAAAAIGVVIGGWHDFRHTLVHMMRRGGKNPVVISGVVGHKSVEMAAEVYDRASAADIGQALSLVGKQLQSLQSLNDQKPAWTASKNVEKVGEIKRYLLVKDTAP